MATCYILMLTFFAFVSDVRPSSEAVLASAVPNLIAIWIDCSTQKKNSNSDVVLESNKI